MLLRAPAALVGKLLIGGQHAIFRFGALACELAAGGLGLALARDMRARGLPLLPRLATIGLCVLAAAIFDAIFFGHPEETLGASLCVGAVLLGGSGRPTLAGLALGGALICKPWGIFALAPALLACRDGILRLCLASLVVALSWMVLAYGVDPLHILRSLSAASNLAVVAHPVDAWWPFDHVVRKAGAETYFALGAAAATRPRGPSPARDTPVAAARPQAAPPGPVRSRRSGGCWATACSSRSGSARPSTGRSRCSPYSWRCVAASTRGMSCTTRCPSSSRC